MHNIQSGLHVRPLKRKLSFAKKLRNFFYEIYYFIFSKEYVLINGLKIGLRHSEFSSTITSSLRRKSYESKEVRVVSNTLTYDDVVLEVGAGIGLTAMTAAKIVNKSSPVIAIEANPNLIPIILKNISLNQANVNVVWGAVGHGCGHVNFYLEKDFWSSSLTAKNKKNGVHVPIIDFQSKLTETGATYLIIDVEGAEVTLFNNIMIPDKLKKICVEVHPRHTGQDAITSMLCQLERNGFQKSEKFSYHDCLYLERS